MISPGGHSHCPAAATGLPLEPVLFRSTAEAALQNPLPILLLLVVQEPWGTKFLPVVMGANGHKAG